MAGDAITVEVEGLDRLTASLRDLRSDLADLAPPDAARLIGAAAQTAAPRRSGALASSMTSETARGRIAVTFGSVYASVHNYGTGPRPGLRGPHNIRATRFLTGTVANKQAEWLAEYDEAAQDAVDKVRGA